MAPSSCSVASVSSSKARKPRRYIARAMDGEAEGRVELVIDLARLSFIDVSGLNVLVLAARRARAAGGSLVLRSPSRHVRRLLDVLRLDAELAVE